MIKKLSLVFLLVLVFFTSKACPVRASTVTPEPNLTQSLVESSGSTLSAEATPSSIVKQIVEKKPDITEPEPEIKGKLEKYLADNPLEPLTVTNFLQHTIRGAVERGVPANTIVLLLLFPIVASLIAASRHLLGIRGLGIFLPAVMSVVFVATGIVVGILLFIIILIVATAARFLLRRLKLQYLPRMSLLLWFVSLGVLGAIFVSPVFNLKELTDISIFPILMLVLLAEQFIGLQVGKSMREAVELTFETMIIALSCSLILNLEFLQKFVLLHPEATALVVALFNIYVGKYTGLRVLEHKKFKHLLK